MDFNQSTEQIMVCVRKQLTEAKGEWPEIVKATGVPYDTLAKLHQGVTQNPRLATITPLIQAFKRRQETGSFARPPARKRSTSLAADIATAGSV